MSGQSPLSFHDVPTGIHPPWHGQGVEAPAYSSTNINTHFERKEVENMSDASAVNFRLSDKCNVTCLNATESVRICVSSCPSRQGYQFH